MTWIVSKHGVLVNLNRCDLITIERKNGLWDVIAWQYSHKPDYDDTSVTLETLTTEDSARDFARNLVIP